MRHLILPIVIILFFSCSKGDDSPTTSSQSPAPTLDAGISGNTGSTAGVGSESGSSSTPAENDNPAEQQNSETLVVFNSNLHSSLPAEWVEQYNIILDTLEKRIPSFANYYSAMDVYSWKSSANLPYRSAIGDASGACICGNDQVRYMILEIPDDEFTYGSMHRYSVIAHEFFHAYQMSISQNFYSSNFRVKWLNEGPAAVFESLYIQEHYQYNYFQNDQNRVDQQATSNPALFENYDSIGDSNYSSSVFITLALVKELMKLNHSEATAIRMVLKDFQALNPSASNWKEVFENLFSISVPAFYQSLSDYTAEISMVLPSESLRLQDVFEN